MSTLTTIEKKLLENLFQMKSGYVLDFSDKSMERFFKESWDISVYDKKYDLDFPSKSKANRLRGIWNIENDTVTSTIVSALIDIAEINILNSGREISTVEKDIITKARGTVVRLLLGGINPNEIPKEVQEIKNKSEIIKKLNELDVKTLEINKRIYLLTVLFSYYEAVVTTYVGEEMFYFTYGIDDLNTHFKILRKKILEIIDSQETFNELKEIDFYSYFILPVQSLYSMPDYVDGIWKNHMFPKLIDFREAIINKNLFENNLEPHQVPADIVIFLDSLKKEIELADIVIKQKTKDFYEIEVPELKKQFFEENVAKTPNASLSFNESTKTLSNSSGKMTPEITGQSLRLLKCFLESPDYKCKRNTIIQTMGGEHQHSGAKNSLKSLLQGVAKIESIRNKSNAREVEFMQLVSE
jgi:hypothetical protein